MWCKLRRTRSSFKSGDRNTTELNGLKSWVTCVAVFPGILHPEKCYMCVGSESRCITDTNVCLLWLVLPSKLSQMFTSPRGIGQIVMLSSYSLFGSFWAHKSWIRNLNPMIWSFLKSTRPPSHSRADKHRKGKFFQTSSVAGIDVFAHWSVYQILVNSSEEKLSPQ